MDERKSDDRGDKVTVDPAELRRIEETSEPAAAKNKPETKDEDD